MNAKRFTALLAGAAISALAAPAVFADTSRPGSRRLQGADECLWPARS